MRPRIFTIAVCFLALAGCTKRNAKKTAPANTDNASLAQSPTPTPNNDKKKTDDTDEAPNWLKENRFKAKKENPATLPANGENKSGKVPWGIAPPQGGWQGANPGAPGVGVLQPQPGGNNSPSTGSDKRAVAMADMQEIWVFMDNRSGASGRMPSGAEVYAALVAAKSPAAELVKDGSIILTGVTTREGVWAYEARAYTNGGLVVSQNGVETLNAAQLKQRLGK